MPSSLTEADCERYISKIVSGIVYLEFDGETLVVNQPSALDRYMGQKIYDQKFDEAIANGVSTREEIHKSLIENKLWSEEEEEELKAIPDKVEDIKVNLYKSYASFKAKEQIRKNLYEHKKRFSELTRKKGRFDSDSAEGYAANCRDAYLLCCSVTNIEGEKFLKSYDYLGEDYVICESILKTYYENYVHDYIARQLCKKEPWKSIWTSSKSEKSVFGKPAADLTTEQKNIISWSRMYDSIYENPDCPPDEVIEDDDMIDGWLILQARERKNAKLKAVGESITSNVKGDEVYVMADSPQDAHRIYSLNDSNSRMSIRQREQEIQQAAKENKVLQVQHSTEAQMEMRNMSRDQFKSKVSN